MCQYCNNYSGKPCRYKAQMIISWFLKSSFNGSTIFSDQHSQMRSHPDFSIFFFQITLVLAESIHTLVILRATNQLLECLYSILLKECFFSQKISFDIIIITNFNLKTTYPQNIKHTKQINFYLYSKEVYVCFSSLLRK